MPAIRDFTQNYSSTTTATLVCSAPDYAENDLLVALCSNDTNAGTLYWMGGEVATSAFLYDATTGFTDYTSQFNNSTASDWWMTSATPLGIGDCFYFGSTSRFNAISVQGTAESQTGGARVWEYSLGGSAWATLTTLVNGIIPSMLIGVHGLVFNPPADWATDTINLIANTYWVRMRVTTIGTLTTRVTCTQGWLGKWNQLSSVQNGTSAHHAIMYKIASASEPEEYAIHDQQATNDTKNALVVSVRDVDTTFPLVHATVAALSNSESNQDSDLSLYNGSVIGTAQSFTSPAVAYRLASAKFYLKKLGSPTGNATVKLYTSAAGIIPTTPTLAISNTYNVANLTTDYQLIEFTFPWYFHYWMAASTVYCIGIEYSDASSNINNCIKVGYENTTPSHAGNAATLTGAVWSAQVYDLCFYTYYFTYSSNTSAAGRFALPTMTTERDNSLILYNMANAAASVPSIIEGPVTLIVGKDGGSHADAMSWGWMKTAGVTPNNVYCSALGTSWTQCASVVAVNPPSAGATIIPAYCVSDSSVYISPSTGAAYLTDAAPVVTATTYFGSTLNSKTLTSSGTTITYADTGVNSYHAMWNVNGVTTAQTWAGNVAVVASRNLSGKNILFHIQPYLPVDIQTTDSVALSGACGVAIGFASTANTHYKVWHVGGANTAWGVQRHIPVVIHSGYTGAGMIQNTGTLVPSAVVDMGFFVSGKVVTPDWLMGSIWALDTTVVAGGNETESLGIDGIVQAAADGHERRSIIKQGSSQFMILQPLQIGNGGTNPVYLELDSTALEFPEQYNKDKKNVGYCSIDDVCGITYYAGPADTIIHQNSIISSASKYHWKFHATSFISVASANRARSSNVATIETGSAHGLSATNSVLVRGMSGTGYNGTWTVASTPDTTHFTYNCTGDNESEIADTGGTIGPEYDFSGLSVIGAGTVTLKAGITLSGISWYSCNEIAAVSAYIDSCAVNTTTGAVALTVASTIETGRITNTSFTGNARALKITASGTHVFDNLTFSGNTYDIENAATSGTVTISATNGSNPTSYINTGGVFAANCVKSYNKNTTTYTDETTDMNNATINDVVLPPIQITTAGDAIYFGDAGTFTGVTVNVGTGGVYSNVTISWEYSKGSSVWGSITTVVDNTNGFQNSGTKTVNFTAPSDWATDTVNTTTKYWIRAVTSWTSGQALTTAPLATQGFFGSTVINNAVALEINGVKSGEERLTHGAITGVGGDGSFLAGNYLRGVTSGAVGTIRQAYDSTHTDVGEISGTFSATEVVNETTTGLADDDTGDSATVSAKTTKYVRCRIKAKAGGDLPVGTQIMNEEADIPYGSEGYYKATESFNYTNDQPVLIRTRCRGYIPFETSGVITSSGLTTTAVWQVDSNYQE